MSYKVIVQTWAERDVDHALLWYEQNVTDDRVLESFWDSWIAIRETLAEFPMSHPIAPEEFSGSITVRNVLFGPGRRKTYRALFLIDDDCVRVLRVRHMRQQLLNERELGLENEID